LGGPRQRAVLAALALRANQVVSVRHLIDAVWENAPASPDSNIRTYVLKLRRVLTDADGQKSRLVTRAGGYLLVIRPGELDVAEFDELAEQGALALRKEDFDAAVTLYRRALGLWRGLPLEGLSTGVELTTVVARLTERRAVVAEQYARARIAAGDPVEAIGDLRQSLATHPLREGLWAQLMLALYQSGRLAEALAAYQEVRRLLADELGLEPGRELRRLHQAIMIADPNLPLVPTGPSPTEVTTTSSCHQLPMDTIEFTGRRAELRRLHQLAGDASTAVVIGAIRGMAGIGKTRLAVRAAHELVGAGQFDEIQLWADLMGFDAVRRPAEPAAVLENFLHWLGVPGRQVPAGVDERAALYRDRLHDKRALVLLDNAATEDQVRPLLPGSSTSFVLITSRHSLAGLDGAQPLALDVFGTTDAIALLARIAGGDRVAAEPEAAERIVALCGHLPIAITLAARRLQARPTWTLRDLANRLARAEHRLDQLTAGNRAIRTTFDLSYQALGSAEAELFRLLGLHPGDDVTSDSVAALVDTTPERAESLLESLLDDHLVLSAERGRYRCHDLLRGYARERAGADQTAEEQAAALRRVLGWYLYAAHGASHMLENDFQRRTDPDPAYQPRYVPQFDSQDEALAWFTAERANLVAAIDSGDDIVAWQLTEAMLSFFRLRGDHDTWISTHHVALAAARRQGNREAEALMLSRLGVVYDDRHRYHDAIGYYQAALAIQRDIGDTRGQGWTKNNLGVMYTHLNQPEQAVVMFQAALTLYRCAGDRRGEGLGLNNLGDTYRELGQLDRAATCLDRALAVQQEIGARSDQRYTHQSLGDFHQDQGRYEAAIYHYERGLAIDREVGDQWEAAGVLTRLGRALDVVGQTDASRRCWQEALSIYRDISDSRADEVADLLAQS
jgi:DNA-binding SARP family transcriptional activator/Tfp pilus assembly protein PilF